MFDFTSHQSKFREFRSSIDRLPVEYSKDLRLLLVNFDQIAMHIQFEQVKCRQKRKITNDYNQLLERYEEYRDNLEQQLVIAILSA